MKTTCTLAERMTYGDFVFRLTVETKIWFIRFHTRYLAKRKPVCDGLGFVWHYENGRRVKHASFAKWLQEALTAKLAAKLIVRVPVEAGMKFIPPSRKFHQDHDDANPQCNCPSCR